MKVFLLTLILVAIAIIAIAVKMFLIKGGEFKKSCSSIDPKTGKKIGCICEKEGKKGDCKNK